MFGKGIGWPEIILILAVVLLLFGAKRLPDTARGLGRSLRIFKAETKGLTDDEAAPPTQPTQAPAPPSALTTPPAELPVPPPVSPPVSPSGSSPAYPPVSAPVSQPEVTPDPGGQR